MSSKLNNVHKLNRPPKQKPSPVASELDTTEILETPVRFEVLEKAIKIAGDDLAKWRSNIDARWAKLAKLAPSHSQIAVMGFDCRVLAYFDLITHPEFKVISEEKDMRKAMIRGLAENPMEILSNNSIGFDPMRFALDLEPIKSDFGA